MSKTFDDFCEQYKECTDKCPLYHTSYPCRLIFEEIQQFLEKEEE